MTVPRLKPITAAELTQDQKQLYDSILHGRRAKGHVGVPLTQEGGALVGPFGALLLSPALGETVQRLGEDVRFSTNINQRQREIAILMVASRTGSSFEWHAHEAIARIIGIDEATIASLKAGTRPDGLIAEEAAVFDLAADLLDRNRVSEETYRGAVVALGERTILEVAVVVGYYRLIAGVLGAFAIEARAAGGDPRPTA